MFVTECKQTCSQKINFSVNIYGQQLIVSFADRLRDEHCFTTPEALSRQLDEDKQQAEVCFERLKYKFY